MKYPFDEYIEFPDLSSFQNSSNQQQETEAEVPMEVDKTPKEDERKEELKEDMDA